MWKEAWRKRNLQTPLSPKDLTFPFPCDLKNQCRNSSTSVTARDRNVPVLLQDVIQNKINGNDVMMGNPILNKTGELDNP